MSTSLKHANKTFLLAVTLMMSSPAVADDYPHWTAQRLVQAWSTATTDCQSGAGNDPEADKACSKRDEINKALFAKGYCLVGGSNSRWEKGPAAKWKRHGEEVVCTWSDMFFNGSQ
jgi:hypothetical protein